MHEFLDGYIGKEQEARMEAIMGVNLMFTYRFGIAWEIA